MNHLISILKRRIAAWIERHIIADDPNPEPSWLDRQDGLGNDDNGGAR